MSIPFKFQPRTTRYRPQNAYWLCRASQLAYERVSGGSTAPDTPGILKELKKWDSGFNKVEGFNKASSQAYIARHDELLIASFRGTDEWQDWLDNVNLPAVHHPLGRVHRGFQLALDDIWPEMLEAIDDLKDNHQTVWITGHSLGGALATLAAAERVVKDQPFYGVYTFGQPRCVDQDFARTFNIEAKSRFFRFQNNNDIVSRIPQRLMGYSHVGTFIYIDSRHNLDTDIGFWFQFVDRLSGILDALNESGVDALEDHKIPQYIAALEKNIDIPPDGL